MKNIFLLVLIVCCITVPASAQSRLYVSQTATGQNNGLSWADAFTDLHQALAAAEAGDELWVAEGEYRPDTATNRDRSFSLKSGVKLYGGFAGTETAAGQRDFTAHPTLLSGNIGNAADSTDNAYTILYMAYPDTSTLVDGFTLRHGYARSDTNFNQTSPTRSGAAVYVLAKGGKGMPRFANCTFRDNYAQNFGGAYFVFAQSSSGSTPVFQNCTFFNNRAGVSGGAVYVSGGNGYDRGIEFDHCKFDLNSCLGPYNTGGCVFMSNSFGPEDLNFWGCEVTRSQAFEGSFLYMYRVGANPVRLNIDSCYLAKNVSSTIELDGIPIDRQTMVRIKRSTFFDEFNNTYLFGLYSTLPNNSPLFDSVDIVDNVFSNNISGYLIYFQSFHGVLKIKNNLFVQNKDNNSPDYNPVITARTTNIEISNNVFIGNFTPIEVQLRTRPGSYLLIGNNLFYENKKAITIDVYRSGASPDLAPAQIVNNVFVNNVVAPFWSSDHTSRNLVSNNIFIGNKSQLTGLPTLPLRLGLDTFVFSHNLFDTSSYCADYPNVTCGPGNLIGLDPLFRDTASGDYSLLPCSPLIDAGSNAAAAGILTDIAGAPRIQGGRVDIGAYEAPAFGLAGSPAVKPSCLGASDGSISISPVSGCEPYTYHWLPDAGNGPELNGLPPGLYAYTVTDGAGRQILDTLLVAEAPVPALHPVVTDVQCGSPLGGSVAAGVSSGTAPYHYHWLPAGLPDTSYLSHLPAIAAGGGGPIAYAVTVTDANGCQDSASAAIALLGAITLSVDGRTVSCWGAADGWLSAAPATGAAPFTWAWQGWPGTDSLARPLGPGNYAVTVEDAYGCTASFAFPPMTQPDSLWATAGASPQTDPDMPDGAAVVTTISGGTSPYGFEWSTGGTGQAIAGLVAGYYSVTVKDKNGCEATVEVFVDSMFTATGEAEGDAWLIYPNPAADWATVLLPRPLPGGHLELAAADGRGLTATVPTFAKASAGKTADWKLDLSGLPAGTYALRVLDRAGKLLFVGKVVKR